MRIYLFLLLLILPGTLFASPQQDTLWTLESCIQYALDQNITIRKTELSTKRSEVSLSQARSERLPNANGSIGQNFGWNKNTVTGSNGFSGYRNSDYSVNAGVTVFSGNRINNQIEQARLAITGSQYALETTKETVSLNILNAYLQVLYSEELVNNSRKQIESIEEQLRLAGERLSLKLITVVDYSQVKSQLASEKLTLANAESQLSIAKITLMQLMEIPLGEVFIIVHPELSGLLNTQITPDVKKIYDTALSIKPQVKGAEINKQIAALDEKIARGAFFPTLSANAGISTAYASERGSGYGTQLNDALSPGAGLTLSIPIFQKNQVRNNIRSARIGMDDAELSAINTRNQLRKDIEQACLDVTSARVKYSASLEKYNSTLESAQLSEEKFNQGIINSVDYLVVKTNLIVSESELLQSKYNLIFSIKVLDFYEGVPLRL
jgi:outer membrane protein